MILARMFYFVDIFIRINLDVLPWNWILSICFCVDKASWNSSEISGLVNQWVFQYGKKSDDFKMILQIYFSETWCNLLNAT